MSWYEPHPFPRFRDYAPSIAIPSVYWDVESPEQRIRAICEILGRVVSYADEMGIEVTRISELLAEIEAGHLDPMIEAAIATWFDENEPEIVANISSLSYRMGEAETDIENLERIINAISHQTIITVEEYGAIGDGVTDSTASIQQAIAENPNHLIAFRGGDYVVSNTIHCWGNFGGQKIDLGGAHINWTGGHGIAAFSIDRTDRLQQGDYLYDYLDRNPIESECRLMNGTIAGADIGIDVKGFHSIVDNFKILGANIAGIRVGDIETHISIQAMITNCLIMKRSIDTLWSEQAEVNAQSLNACDAAIICYDPDSLFSNINVNRYSVSVRIHAGGQFFSNCHFTCQYKNARNAVAESAAVVFDLWTPTSIYTDVFDSCYFDNHKYCLYTDTPPRHVIQVTDGQYFNSNRQIADTVPSYQCYMAKGFQYLRVRDFNVVPGSRCQFIPAKLILLGDGYQALTLCDEEYTPNIYALADTAHVFYTANQKAIAGKIYDVIRPANEISNGANQCVGCIVVPGSTVNRMNPVKIVVSDRFYLWFEGLLRWTGSQLVFHDVITHGSSLDRYSLWFGDIETITLENRSFCMIPIYIHANRDFSNTPIYMSASPDNTNTTVFFNAGGLKSHSSTGYLLQHNFSAT